jgi:hypothetical protein
LANDMKVDISLILTPVVLLKNPVKSTQLSLIPTKLGSLFGSFFNWSELSTWIFSAIQFYLRSYLYHTLFSAVERLNK